ncbi:MAG: hypothetical protein AB7I38_05430 [Dehalococcoidia bacterium]
MADPILDLAKPPVAEWQHDSWTTYEEYKNVHAQRVSTLSGYIVAERLSWDGVTSHGRLVEVHIHGRFECVEGVEINVDKLLAVSRGRGPQRVQGKSYRYWAWQKDGLSEVDLIGYDCSPHFEGPHTPDGLDCLHRHTFHPLTGKETIEKIPLDELPNLHSLIPYAVELGRIRRQWR